MSGKKFLPLTKVFCRKKSCHRFLPRLGKCILLPCALIGWGKNIGKSLFIYRFLPRLLTALNANIMDNKLTASLSPSTLMSSSAFWVLLPCMPVGRSLSLTQHCHTNPSRDTSHSMVPGVYFRYPRTEVVPRSVISLFHANGTVFSDTLGKKSVEG